MLIARRLLAVAAWVCGPHARRLVFEPLVADWQQEWRSAPRSRLARARIAASGATALLIAFATCLLTGGVSMTRTALTRGLLTLALSTLVLVALQVALMSRQLSIDWIIELRVWMALSQALTFMIPLAMLPAMMLWRGLGVGIRAAAFTVVAAGVMAVLVAGWLAPKTQGEPPFSDRWQEAMYRRMIEHDRGARYAYPASAVRALRPSTPEQRAAARQQQRSDPRYLEYQARQTSPRWNVRTFTMGGLTIAFGALGWALGALGRTRPIHAVAWWTLACVALLSLDTHFGSWLRPLGMRGIHAAPWAPIALFGTAAALLLLDARRRQAPRP